MDNMLAERSGFLSRSGPAIAVIGLHVLIVYGLVVSMGIVETPNFAAPVQAIFIPEQTSEPEPEIQVKPKIEDVVDLNEPVPEVQYEEPVVVPPAETPMPASQNAIAATPAESAPAQDLKTANRVEPIYPAASRRAGEEGTVRLKVLVDENGRPRDVTLLKGSGFARLDDAAMDAVRKWRFVAASDGTRKIQAWTQVAITFQLTDAERKA
jgi:protein TonB